MAAFNKKKSPKFIKSQKPALKPTIKQIIKDDMNKKWEEKSPFGLFPPTMYGDTEFFNAIAWRSSLSRREYPDKTKSVQICSDGYFMKFTKMYSETYFQTETDKLVKLKQSSLEKARYNFTLKDQESTIMISCGVCFDNCTQKIIYTVNIDKISGRFDIFHFVTCFGFDIKSEDITNFIHEIISDIVCKGLKYEFRIDTPSRLYMIFPMIYRYCHKSLNKQMISVIQNTPEYDGVLYEKLTGRNFDFKNAYNNLFPSEKVQEPPQKEIQPENNVQEEGSVVTFEKSDECGVCYSNYDCQEHFPVVLNVCKHAFCDSCIKGIINQDNKLKCPFCGHDYSDDIQKAISQIRIDFID